MKLNKISSSKFIWQNSFNCNMEVTPMEYDHQNTNKWYFRKPWKIIGYTYNPYFKRDDSEVGVMFENEEDFSQLWCHCRLDMLLQMGYRFENIPEEIKKKLLYRKGIDYE